MKRNIKRITAILVALALVICLIPAFGSEAFAGGVYVELEDCGQYLNTLLRVDDHALFIEPKENTEEMAHEMYKQKVSEEDDDYYPWATYRNSMEKIFMWSGCSGISPFAFWNMPKLDYIMIPRSLYYISWDAFYKTNVGSVFYGGSKDEFEALIPVVSSREGNDTFFNADIVYMDQGELTVDLSRGSHTYNLLDGAAIYETLCWLADYGYGYTDFKGNFDIDTDGIFDVNITNDGRKYTVTKCEETLITTDTYSVELTSELKDNLYDYILDTRDLSEDNYLYYGKLNFMYKKLPFDSATVSNISDKVYTGSEIKPVPTVKYEGNKLINGLDYTITYKNNKSVGKATVTFTGRGIYEGTLTKTFKINPKGTTLKTPAALKSALTVKWNKQSTKMASTRITGYQIQLATNSAFTKNKKEVKVKGYSVLSKKVTKLKAKTKYYIRIRTYKTVNGTTYYSKWSGNKTKKTN